ncbi:hypothetical protein CXB51_009418 [Gossypium anomalum]|uniref:Uncharacterized protein n=1 Tax=Gossypium anomalum TaxID=47600 RepID=A0A8J5YYB3_9ROSI|nr:hypothetical protein CXB51_009418 [Gossypium anomalum]
MECMADFNGETSNKDKRYRQRAKDCHELQEDLICMILDGDDKYRTTRRWKDKRVIVMEAMNRLRDLQQWLRKLQSGIVENPSFSLSSNNAFQELHSVLSQPTNPEMEVQGEAIEDQKEQLISEAKDFRMVAEVLNKVWASYVAKQQLTDPVSIQDLVQTDDESFIFHFPLTPDCSRCAKIRINLQGYHEVDPDLSSLWFFDVEKYGLENHHLPDFGHQYPGEGSSEARANQENMKLSNEYISPVQGYTTFMDAMLMCSLRYFKSTLILITGFSFRHANFQNILTNSLTEADHNIESKPERLELKDITNIEDLLSPRFFDVEKYDLENRHLPDFGHQYPGEGSSDARASQGNMKLSYENISPVQGHADFHNILANSLTEADHYIESKPERLELKDITNIEDLSSLWFFDVEKNDLENHHLPDFGHQYPAEGSGDARANQENMKLSHENTSPVQGHADFKNILANSLTEADHNIERKPERLELKDITNIEDLSSLWFFDVEKYDLENRHLPDFGHQYPGEGSSDARANQENMKLSYENTSPVQGHADFQSILANSLTEADHNIESKPERLELKDITNIEVRVQNIRNNLEKAHFGHQYPSEGSNNARANQENMKLSHENTSPVQRHADFQSILANSLTEADHNIESKPERLELKDITNIEVRVQNIRNNLEKAPEKKKLEEGIRAYIYIDIIEGLLLLPDFFDRGTFDDLGNWDLSDFGHQYPGEGSNNARANQENMKLLHENTSPVQRYTTFMDAMLMCSLRYFKSTLILITSFLFRHADFENILSNSLAEADHKESNPERLRLRDITNMEVTVQNKRNNLEEETKKNKANIAKGKRKVEKGEAGLKENILKVVKDVAGLKENRMMLRKDDAKLQENQLKLTSLPKKPRDDKIDNDLAECSGDVRANQDNMKLSTVQGHADVQRIIMNSLAEVYHKIESNPEILELKVITTMEATVQNIMNKLMKAREMEYQAEEKRFEKKKANARKDKLKLEKDEADLKEKKLKLDQDEADLKEKELKLDQDEAELKENQLKLARLQKKPRLE